MMLSLVTVLANSANIPTLFYHQAVLLSGVPLFIYFFVLNIKEKLIMFHKV